jgi:hypothetical protein
MGKLTDRLAAIGISNAAQFARQADAVAWISWNIHHPHAIGYNSYRATVHFTRDGKRYKKEFRPQQLGLKPKDKRAEAVTAAQEWASARFGVTEWVAGPYRDSWMPKGARERVLSELKQ